ncbi:MAG: methyltransferase domain-containing protein [Dehalococcoidia bacterium]|nr:methyltransferase domain-containing protein [Dehalococcoidia bacterium]
MTTDVPQFGGRPFYGYDSATIQRSYTNRDAVQVADFLVPRLSEGMSLLDCGCGPGPLTLGFAEIVAPGRVVGIDIEPTMIDQANQLKSDGGPDNLEFQVGDIYDLSFEDGEFDVVFSSAVIEHLSDPVRALREVLRVTKLGGIGAVIRTDWSFPFIVPECPELSRFFKLFEGGFNRIGGSLNWGRFLSAHMREAGFDVVEFQTNMSQLLGQSAASASAETYISWIENIPLFQESIELGITTDAELKSMVNGIREWAKHPDAYLSLARGHAIGVKNGQ